jgi:hypothetical protein
MIMFDQSRRLSEPLRWGRREKTASAVLLSCVALALIGLGAYALTSGAPARRDCIEPDLREHARAARVLHDCGARARRVCASGDPLPATASPQELRSACRRPDSRSPLG